MTEQAGFTATDMATAAAQGFRDGQKAAGVPEGWKLVPVEPTREMIDAYLACNGRFHSASTDWAALLSAAPTPEPASPWISVEDRLPEIGERVIGFTGEVEEVTYWAPKHGVHDGEAGFCDAVEGPIEVTHWMPLPAAPEQPAKEVQ